MRTFRDVRRVTEDGTDKAIITWVDDQQGIMHIGVDNPPASDLEQWARDYMTAYIAPPPPPPPTFYTVKELGAEAAQVDSLVKARALLGKYANALGGQIPKP